MASRDELEAKRQLARKRHRAVSQKASRLKAKGIDITGTKYDVRKDPKSFDRLNSKQLDAHIARLNAFTSRSTQFAVGAKGHILPGHLMNRYNKLQNQLGREKKASLNKIANTFIPSQGMTVGQRVAASTPDHPVTAPPSSYAPHIHYTRSSTGIPNEKALKKLLKQAEADQNGGFFDRKFKSQTDAAKKMIRGIRNDSLSKDFKTLTPEEFNLLWNYTDFAEVTAMDYVIRKSMMHDKKELAWYDVALDSQLRIAKARIAEIKSLNLGGKKKNATRKKGKLGS